MSKRSFRAHGFSLIELLVTVVIIGILSAIAMPSYTQYVLRSNRTTAQALLAESAQYMERYFTTNNTYADAALPSAVVPRNATGTAIRYNISFSGVPDGGGFTLQAVPANAQAGDACGTLTMTSTGAQTAARDGCW